MGVVAFGPTRFAPSPDVCRVAHTGAHEIVPVLALIIVEDEGSMIGFAAAVPRCVLTQIFVASGQRHLSPPTEKHGASQLSIPGHCHEATAQSCGCVVTASDADH